MAARVMRSAAAQMVFSGWARGSMPAELTQRLEHLEALHCRRSAFERSRHLAELDSLDLDWAAYQLACQHDDAGDLTAAARWYGMGAANDFADAALRLGKVLEALATQRAAVTGPGYYTAQREELALVSDAARWYAEAYGAGHSEAAERLDDMISNHDTRRPRAAAPAAPPVSTDESCRQVGLGAVVNDSDLTTATAHFCHCTSCQNEFLRLGGLLPGPQDRSPQGHPATSDDPDTSRHQALASQWAG